MPEIDVYPLPAMLDPARVPGSTAVVIDVLRATSVLVQAAASGAARLCPVLEIDEAKKLKATLDGSGQKVLLAGERGGLPIGGFDLGNSPQDFTPRRVGGKTLIFTTTNGTVAMHAVRAASTIVPAAFLNAAAVVRFLQGRERVAILCAGTEGVVTEEDMLLAGCLVSRLRRIVPGEILVNPAGADVETRWDDLFVWQGRENVDPAVLVDRLRDSRGGRNLVGLGLDEDIRAAAAIDSVDIVPVIK